MNDDTDVDTISVLPQPSKLIAHRALEPPDDYDRQWYHIFYRIRKLIVDVEDTTKAVEILRQYEASSGERGEKDVQAALLYGIITDVKNFHRYYILYRNSMKDNFQFGVGRIKSLVIEKFPRLLDHCRTQVLWITREFVRKSAPEVEGLVLHLLRQIMGGNTSHQMKFLIQSLHDILDTQYDIWVKRSNIAPVIFHVFTRAAIDFSTAGGPSSSSSGSSSSLDLSQKLASLCLKLWKDKSLDIALLGKELIRVVLEAREIAQLDSYDPIWEDLSRLPDETTKDGNGEEEEEDEKGHVTIVHLMTVRAPRTYIQSRLTREMEEQLRFMMTCVPLGQQRRYQLWFQSKFHIPGENENIIPDLIRYICCVYHPDKKIIASKIMPRWAMIGWLVKCGTKPESKESIMRAICFDFLFFTKKDPIMNIEPIILLMIQSVKNYPEVSLSILQEFIHYVQPVNENQQSILHSPVIVAQVQQNISLALTMVQKLGVVQNLKIVNELLNLSASSKKEERHVLHEQLFHFFPEHFGALTSSTSLVEENEDSTMNDEQQSSSSSSSFEKELVQDHKPPPEDSWSISTSEKKVSESGDESDNDLSIHERNNTSSDKTERADLDSSVDDNHSSLSDNDDDDTCSETSMDSSSTMSFDSADVMTTAGISVQPSITITPVPKLLDNDPVATGFSKLAFETQEATDAKLLHAFSQLLHHLVQVNNRTTTTNDNMIVIGQTLGLYFVQTLGRVFRRSFVTTCLDTPNSPFDILFQFIYSTSSRVEAKKKKNEDGWILPMIQKMSQLEETLRLRCLIYSMHLEQRNQREQKEELWLFRQLIPTSLDITTALAQDCRLGFQIELLVQQSSSSSLEMIKNLKSPSLHARLPVQSIICLEIVPYLIENYPQWSSGSLLMIQFIVETITPELKWKLVSRRDLPILALFDVKDSDLGRRIFSPSLDWPSYAQRNLWELFFHSFNGLTKELIDLDEILSSCIKGLAAAVRPQEHFEAMSGILCLYQNQPSSMILLESLMEFPLPNFESLVMTVCLDWIRRKDSKLMPSIEQCLSKSTSSEHQQQWILHLCLLLLLSPLKTTSSFFTGKVLHALEKKLDTHPNPSWFDASMLSRGREKIQRLLQNTHLDPREPHVEEERRPAKKQKH